ncbi:hypothetical protein P1J78_22835 [Psychromarinibacter sp. C21-152]|uniref:Uncharacterized protein n=1 Tax=Psychromarinibacter sediminicola TaxID=3033385 RepID=A0AAE3NZ66_9RHOB|nr:hypothetical protein [Psychromarinibacter sediminicola]MDF0603570.1 hypothetical protein [Psychromarinibacter sediminicola]
MGWTFMYPPRDEKAEILRLHELVPDAPYTCEVLRIPRVNTIWYCAVRYAGDLKDSLVSGYTLDPDGSVVWCSIFLTKRDRGEWGYKGITEDMAPAPQHCKCPAGVLKLLSPTTNEHALDFRRRSLRWNSRPRPKVGDRIRTAVEVSGYGRTFTKRNLGRSVYESEKTGQLVRLSGYWLDGMEII